MKTIYIDGLQFSRPSRAYFLSAKKSGLDIIHFTIVYWENILETMTQIGDWLRLIEENADLVYPILNEAGLANINDDKLGIVFGFQNCSPIENNIDMIGIYRRLNVGVMQLSYNNQSPLCGGCYEKEDIGLSRFGKQAIKEMNRVGMIIDLSHSSNQATLEAIECSERPISITHAQSLTFKPAVRNKPDETLVALAKSGGLFGLSFYPFHIKNHGDCTMTELTDEIKRLIDLIGVDHIAIGSDLCQDQPISALSYMRNGHWTKTKDYGESSTKEENWPKQPKWFERVDDFANLEKAFIEHGIGQNETDKILGGNWLSFYQNAFSPQK